MPHLNPERSYRLAAAARAGEVPFQVVVAETDLHVLAKRDLSAETAGVVRRLRGQLSSYLLLQPEFGRSLVPVEAKPGAPEIFRRMAAAAAPFGVGPMAAVAGTVSQMVGEALAAQSAELLIENGGDCWLASTTERVVGLLADPKADMRLGLRLQADEFPLGLCASSGKIGHSLSFGHGDVLVVRSQNASLADAAATSLANRLRSAADLESVLAVAQAWEKYGVDGVFAQVDGQLAAWGKMELAVLGEAE